jgi:hypothetical protein
MSSARYPDATRDELPLRLAPTCSSPGRMRSISNVFVDESV